MAITGLVALIAAALAVTARARFGGGRCGGIDVRAIAVNDRAWVFAWSTIRPRAAFWAGGAVGARGGVPRWQHVRGAPGVRGAGGVWAPK